MSEMTGLIKDIGNPVKVISSDEKIRYHAACVFASNLVIGLYSNAAKLLVQSGFEREDALKALLPLFMNNAANVEKFGAVNALTGPIERADGITVSEHLDVLEGDDRKVYRLLSRELVDIAGEKNPKNDYEKILELLGEEN